MINDNEKILVDTMDTEVDSLKELSDKQVRQDMVMEATG
jgi:hypothetical protein